MELKSEPKYDTVQVTDIDIAFPGDLQTFTLRDPQDSYIEDGDFLWLSLGGGSIKFNLAHAHYVAKRQRTIRVPAPADQAGKSAVPPVA